MPEAIIFMLLYPLTTAYYASSKGYSALTWYFIGFFLPLISAFILMFIRDNPNPKPVAHIIHEHNDRVLYKRDA